MWYKRQFTIPEDWSDENVLLHFGAVDWETTVYVNGEKVGDHRGGYTAFSFDITDYLVEGENELIVHVYDPLPMRANKHLANNGSIRAEFGTHQCPVFGRRYG